MPDHHGHRRIIGVLVPSSNTATQPELEAMRPRGVTNQTGRITAASMPIPDDDAFRRYLALMQAGIGTAVDQIRTCEPDHLVMGLSLEAFWDGVEGSAALRRSLEARAGTGVTLGSDAMLAALERLGAGKRIALLTPHQPVATERVARFFGEAGYTVVRTTSLAFASGLMYARVSDLQMRDAIVALDGPDVDAVVQVGTNFPMSRFAADACTWLGKPVLAMNSVLYWHALRACGIDDPVDGFGPLLAHH